MAFTEYKSFAEQLLKNYGWKQTVKILKDLQTAVNLTSLGQKVEARVLGGVWFKIGPNGFPKALPRLYKLVVDCPLAANTLAGFVRTLRVKPNYSVATITDSCTSVIHEGDMGCFKAFLKKQPQVTVIPHCHWHASVKAGPNGPGAILTSAPDALAIANDRQHLVRYITSCLSVGMVELAWNFTFLVNDAKSSWTKTGNKSMAKLAFLADKAGKTRIVYILNWWDQELLLPLHNAMMKWLSSQPQDGTFCQEKVADKVKAWTKEGIPLWSYDLTAATDRWPVCHQYTVVRALFGKAWAGVWFNSLTTVLPDTPNGKVAYQAGQPMGAYASWAALSVTHHLTVRFLASQIGVEPRYVILGDDIVIADGSLAKAYEKYLVDLGVTISQAKSVVPEKSVTKDSAAEFAKKLFRSGSNISPLSSDLLNEIYNLHQWWKAVEIMQEICERMDQKVYITTTSIWLPNPLKRFLDTFPIKEQERLRTLLGDTFGLKRPFCEEWADSRPKDTLLTTHSEVKNPWMGVGQLSYLHYWGEEVANKLEEKANELNKLKGAISEEALRKPAAGLQLTSWNHPVKKVLDSLTAALVSCYTTVANGEESPGSTNLMMDADTLIEVLTKGKDYRSYLRQKDRKMKLTQTLSVKVLKLCKGA